MIQWISVRADDQARVHAVFRQPFRAQSHTLQECRRVPTSEQASTTFCRSAATWLVGAA